MVEVTSMKCAGILSVFKKVCLLTSYLLQESMVTSYSEQLCTINWLSGILMNHLDNNDDDDHEDRLCKEAVWRGNLSIILASL